MKIGAHVYRVVMSDDDSECGSTDYIKSEISINRKMSQSMKESTLIHELIHACNTTIAEDHASHALIDSLADQLYHALSANNLLHKENLRTLLHSG